MHTNATGTEEEISELQIYKYAAPDSKTSQNRSVTKMFACLAHPAKKGQSVTEPGKVIKLKKSRQCAICEGILLRPTN